MATLWFNPISGSDSYGNGSPGAPFRTPRQPINVLKSTGLGPGVTEIRAQVAGKFRADINITEPLPGMTGQPGQLQIIGVSNLANPKASIWSPPANKSAITVTNGASITVKGFFFDGMDAYNEAGYGAQRIFINSGGFSTVWTEDLGFGYGDWTMGYVNVQDMGRHQHFGYVWIDTPSATATGTRSTASKDISLSGLSGVMPLTRGCGVSGPGIPPGTFVTATDGATEITINNFPTSDGTDTVNLRTGISAPFGIGQMSVLLNGNFNAPGSEMTYIGGQPHFLNGLLFADEMSLINWGSLVTNLGTQTKPVSGSTGNPVVTVNDIFGVVVGAWAHAPQLPFGTKVVSIDGLDVTLDAAPTGTPTSIKFGVLPSVIGPKLTIWGNSLIKPPGRRWQNLPGNVDPVVTDDHGRGRITEGGQLVGPAGVGAIHEDRSLI